MTAAGAPDAQSDDGRATDAVTWWRDVSTWRQKWRGGRECRGVTITEAEPGVVHITTTALEDLLRLAGFKPGGTP